MNLNELRDAVHATAREKGWWEGAEVGVPGDASTVTVERSFGELLALVHSEVSEALEDWRNGYEVNKTRWQVHSDPRSDNTVRLEGHSGDPWLTLRFADGSTHEINPANEDHRALLWEYGFKVKPIGIPSELADIIIRVLDIAGAYGVDIEDAVRTKMEYNATREVRHGGKRA